MSFKSNKECAPTNAFLRNLKRHKSYQSALSRKFAKKSILQHFLPNQRQLTLRFTPWGHSCVDGALHFKNFLDLLWANNSSFWWLPQKAGQWQWPRKIRMQTGISSSRPLSKVIAQSTGTFTKTFNSICCHRSAQICSDFSAHQISAFLPYPSPLITSGAIQ